VGSAEVGVDEVGFVEVSSNEVGSAEVRSETWILLSPPGVPSLWPLPKTFKVLLVGHCALLLCFALIIEAHMPMRKHTSSYEQNT